MKGIHGSDSTSTTQSGGRKGEEGDNELLFKYPFEDQEQGSRIMKKLIAGLRPIIESESESESENESENASVPIKQNPKTTSRIKDIIEIRSSDRGRLAPGQFLNDSIIDLWLRFISSNNNNSTCHFFTSHFYTQLEKKGPGDVRSWFTAKNLDVFSKRLVFVPVNARMHWSLAVIVNPGALVNGIETDKSEGDDEEEAGCIICLDSYGGQGHKKKPIAETLRKLLNDQWKIRCEQQQQQQQQDEEVSERSERALTKTRAMHPVKWLQS